VSESEDRGEQPEGEKLRESVDENESPAVDGRASADDVARSLKDQEERAEEVADG